MLLLMKNCGPLYTTSNKSHDESADCTYIHVNNFPKTKKDLVVLSRQCCDSCLRLLKN